MTYLLFVVGIFLLVKSAGWIVDSSSSIAKRLGVSSLVIGLTVVAFGTSLPELVVNLFAAGAGSGSISFGNIVGSNIANILLVLGITAIIGNIKIKSDTVWKEIPFALLAGFVLFALTWEKEFFTRNDGLVLLSLFVLFLYYIFMSTRKDKEKIGFVENVDGVGLRIGLKLVLGFVGIYFGGRFVVDGAIAIAGTLGLSEYLISATIIAVGTSLPELVVGIMAVLRKDVDLAVGNIVGSNIFNVFGVFGIIPFIGPIGIPSFVGFDIAIMFLTTLLLFVFMFLGKKGELSKTEGIVFVMFYILYIWFIIIRG